MSGGVDSSAAAIILSELGYEVIGVSMQVWDYRKHGGNAAKATCCAPSDFEDARQIAEANNFPFYVFDFEDSFHASVIKPFVDSYLEGKTPNPCLDCNRQVKFKQLRNRARALGVDKVATGHYAQILQKPDGSWGLYTSVDQEKDQSYFLYALNQDDLQHTLFPVGGMVKSQVREILSTRGFGMASKAESQDICFVGGTVGDFIKKESGRELPPGKFVNAQGEVLGEHAGVHNFTVGQRRGLGISNPNPLYVIDIDHSSQEVRVGEKAELEKKEFFVENINWISGQAPSSQALRALVKLRYRHQGVLCDIYPNNTPENQSARVVFLNDWTPVSPGQAAVFYTPTPQTPSEVLGGGRIVKG